MPAETIPCPFERDEPLTLEQINRLRRKLISVMGGKATRALTPDKAARARALLAAGHSKAAIARELGVGYRTILRHLG